MLDRTFHFVARWANNSSEENKDILRHKGHSRVKGRAITSRSFTWRRRRYIHFRSRFVSARRHVCIISCVRANCVGVRCVALMTPLQINCRPFRYFVAPCSFHILLITRGGTFCSPSQKRMILIHECIYQLLITHFTFHISIRLGMWQASDIRLFSQLLCIYHYINYHYIYLSIYIYHYIKKTNDLYQFCWYNGSKKNLKFILKISRFIKA